MEEAGDPPRSASRSTSTRKRSRPSDAAACGGLISALPDSIILHVLSFLDIKDVVKTSALSRRWYSLWTQTSAVSVDFGTRNCVVKGEFEFVELFLLMCTSPTIRKLHLLDLNYYDGLKGMVDRWIRFAVVRRVEDLRIGLEDGVVVDTYVLPRALLRCESLTRLRLEYCGFPSFLGTISWSSLKVLSVHRTKLVDEVINGVLEGSPLLESLTLEACYGMNCIRIFSKVMRELVIRRYCYLPDEYIDEEDENHRHKNFCLEISIPNLRSMRLLGRWKGKEVVLVKQVSSLVDVELNFSLEIDETNSDIIYGTMKGIIRKLRFVDKVVIGNEILMDLHNYKGNGDASLELKCRHLTITTSADRYSLGQIAEVLECAPNVETLVIDFTPEMHFEAIPLNKAPFCNKFKSWNRFTSRIRNIEIIGFPTHYGTEPMYWLARLPNKKKWLSLIKFLLRDAQVLEKMVINFSAKWSWGYPVLYLKEADDAREVLQVATDILGYPRGSKAAKVVFNYPFK